MADGSPHEAVAEVHLLQDASRRDLITELNAAQSPLLRLPAEIRNAIYTFVFSDQVYRYDVSGNNDSSIICRAEYPCLGLLLASRQVHHETALLPYELATFVFEIKELWKPSELHTFATKRLKAQLAALGLVEVVWRKSRRRVSAADFLTDYDDDLLVDGGLWGDWFHNVLCA
ncbi:uncharacterized protein J4E84_009517 [Alternaria hordeiaustralica]|uniref:uncharacterized protein n=1 Tax=Alternaria hordeiaustralica TaxID=1187925 RepID=UPI0020C56344|nr:uncharacterized protein J4E84_009517 [Alternaria hordeiaustralica]KAI4676682.1 hypothetical protein J4E84_009517 [Alternaria hordeiaustralica]